MVNIARNSLIKLNTLPQMSLKLLLKRQFKKTTETACDLIGVITANTITEVSNISQQNNLETVTNDNDKEIPKERYISPEETHKKY